ncbi:hypothetical protein WNY59_14315 [Ahrensia kielensis]|uniref:Peptidase S11 D-alanyl-D-alanine carboxypeptidase A N-terminal domain-containing protein n=1 Tax=Ahrensia kielensis TaxID=76980 RepID=A0ABU9T9F0_9HYPH
MQSDNAEYGPAAASVINFDTLVVSGVYQGYNATGAPVRNHQAVVWHVETSRAYQMAITQRTGESGSIARHWFRYRTLADWDEWQEVATTEPAYVEPTIVATAGIIKHISNLHGVPDSILYSKAPTTQIAPASLTKVLTAITAIRTLENLHVDADKYEISVITDDEVGGSGSNVAHGDVLSFTDAMKNMFLPSSNNTATALARNVGALIVADEDAAIDPLTRFITEMNCVAAALGLSNSTFKNATGLYAEGQVSSVSDMSLLLVEASGLTGITEVWGLESAKITIIGPNIRTEKIIHSVSMISDYDVLGGKSGTLIPGIYHACLLVSAPKGNRIVAVVMQSASHQSRYSDIRTMIDAVTCGFDWPVVIPTARS